MIMSHRIELNPNNKQATFFAQCAGAARFAYNWALAMWMALYKEGGKPNEAMLRRMLNAIKAEQFPWMLALPKSVIQQAIKNLGNAFSRFFARTGKYPKFKKKGKSRDSFRVDNGPQTKGANAIEVRGRSIRIPKLGWVRMREEVRFQGQIKSAVISRHGDRWFVSLTIEVQEAVRPPRDKNQVVGVDLGVSRLATLSTGEVIENDRPLRRMLKKLARVQRQHARKQKGSHNRQRSALLIARLHRKIANRRAEILHQLTHRLTRDFSRIVIEDLNVKGMVKNHNLAQAISDCGFYEFRRQLEYKAPMRGGEVIVADRFFPSSKTCSACGNKQEKMPLSVREWTCPNCGATHDRDHNAAINLALLAA